VKTGVQSVLNALKTLDSGFRRNDVKKNKADFFTSSLFQRGRLIGSFEGCPTGPPLPGEVPDEA